jgi:hypothetical protein
LKKSQFNRAQKVVKTKNRDHVKIAPERKEKKDSEAQTQTLNGHNSWGTTARYHLHSNRKFTTFVCICLPTACEHTNFNTPTWWTGAEKLPPKPMFKLPPNSKSR